MNRQVSPLRASVRAFVPLALLAACASSWAVEDYDRGQKHKNCAGLPTHGQLKAALVKAQGLGAGGNGGFGFHMWGSVVNRDGVVCAVAFTGSNRGSQWPGSRVISAQKAYTANAFSLPEFALSTANLYAAVQPGGSLYGLQHSNPVGTEDAYRGPAQHWGTHADPMVGQRVGGVNVFGGGVALYNAKKVLIGAIGVSGDSSCADHAIAWRTRNSLMLDFVPAGVGPGNSDQLIYGGAAPWSQPHCVNAATEDAVLAQLPPKR